MSFGNSFHKFNIKNRKLLYFRALFKLVLNYIQKDVIFSKYYNIRLYSYFLYYHSYNITIFPRHLHIRNICLISGRHRGNFRKLKIARSQIKKYTDLTIYPGLIKSSW